MEEGIPPLGPKPAEVTVLPSPTVLEPTVLPLPVPTTVLILTLEYELSIPKPTTSSVSRTLGGSTKTSLSLPQLVTKETTPGPLPIPDSTLVPEAIPRLPQIVPQYPPSATSTNGLLPWQAEAPTTIKAQEPKEYVLLAGRFPPRLTLLHRVVLTGQMMTSLGKELPPTGQDLTQVTARTMR